MRICVVGCGAVGSLFAANLAQLDDVEVWAYDLAREHVDAINATGLRLSGAGDVLGRVRATSNANELPPCDFGIVATKAMHTAAATEATAQAFAGGCVASVQNGIGNEEAIAQHVERVIRGTTFPAGRVLEPGHVQWDVKGDTTFGPFEPQPAPQEQVERLTDACTRAGMPAAAVPDARGPQWRKVIFNAATNPLGALTGSRTDASANAPTCARSSPRSSTRARPSPQRKRSSSTTIRSGSSTTRPARMSRTTTRRRCSRTSRPAGQRRSTTSTAASFASVASTACRRHSTKPCGRS